MIASTPKPPYYAVIFTSIKKETDDGYNTMGEKMIQLAKEQAGFLGVESARNDVGITVSYWATLEDIHQWKQHTEHLIAQQYGREKWYKFYCTRICKVERDYSFIANN